MKKIIVACLFLSLSSFAFSTIHDCSKPALKTVESSVSKKQFVQSIWTVINIEYEANKAFFYPYNEYEVGFNHGSKDFDNALLEEHSRAYKTNLYNIIFRHVLKGELTVYSPYDPTWYVTRDKGYLHFPVCTENFSSEKNKVYANDSILRIYLKNNEMIGCRDHSYFLVAIESVQYPGEDSLNANNEVVYYRRPFEYYADSDIIAFNLREELIIDENGHIINRKIKALAPVTNAIDYSSDQIIGTKELFWLDFEELNPFLKNYYVLLDGIYEKKVKSFSQIFKERIFISNLIEQDSSFVAPVK